MLDVAIRRYSPNYMATYRGYFAVTRPKNFSGHKSNRNGTSSIPSCGRLRDTCLGVTWVRIRCPEFCRGYVANAL